MLAIRMMCFFLLNAFIDMFGTFMSYVHLGFSEFFVLLLI